MKRQQRKRDRKDQRGSVMVLSSVAMLAVLLAVGLGVDISHFYLAKTELQNAADAAALAAASTLNSTTTGIINGAWRATAVVNKYEFNKDTVQFTSSDAILWSANLDGPYLTTNAASASEEVAKTIRFVKVTTEQSPVSISFASVVLGNNKNMSATATAGLSVPINTYCGFIPLAVLIADDDDQLDPYEEYTIRAPAGNGVSPGDYQILSITGPGGDDVGMGIGSGVDACLKVGETYKVDCKPGLTAGKVRTGLNSRFDDYGGSQLDPTAQPPDTNIKEGISWTDYNKNVGCGLPGNPACNAAIVTPPSHPGVERRREVLIPLVKISEFEQGRCEVKFTRFGNFFLKTKPANGSGGEMKAEFIANKQATGKGTWDPNGGVGDPSLAVPVLYR
jgi:Flp pilus assembly protein TadG